jgi:hypothetical protein
MSLRHQLRERYGKEHLSYSSLKHALGDMRYFDMYMRGEIKKTSDALHFGNVYDCLLLTPSEFEKSYAVIDEDYLLSQCSSATKMASRPKATKEFKSLLEQMKDTVEQEAMIPVMQDDYAKAQQMIERLDQEGLLDSVLSGGQAQVMFNEDVDGVPLKGFIDYLHVDFVLDSKSSRAMDKFKYDVRSFCYDIQAYIYTLVTGRKEFYWLVQEKNDPYYPGLVTCSEKTLFDGEMKFSEALENIKEWLSTDESEQDGFARFTV